MDSLALIQSSCLLSYTLVFACMATYNDENEVFTRPTTSATRTILIRDQLFPFREILVEEEIDATTVVVLALSMARDTLKTSTVQPSSAIVVKLPEGSSFPETSPSTAVNTTTISPSSPISVTSEVENTIPLVTISTTTMPSVTQTTSSTQIASTTTVTTISTPTVTPTTTSTGTTTSTAVTSTAAVPTTATTLPPMTTTTVSATTTTITTTTAITTTTTPASTTTTSPCLMCSSGLVQAAAAGSLLPLPGFVVRMALITPTPPNAMGCVGLTATCPPGVGNLMLFNLGTPALAIPIAGGIIATLTCSGDGSWRTANLPLLQLGMSITRVWCLTPLGVLPPGIPGLPGIFPSVKPPRMPPPAVVSTVLPIMPGVRAMSDSPSAHVVTTPGAPVSRAKTVLLPSG